MNEAFAPSALFGDAANDPHIARFEAVLLDACQALERCCRARTRGMAGGALGAMFPMPDLPLTSSQRAAPSDGSALDATIAWFSLSRFETLVLVLAAGAAISDEVGNLCALAHGDPARPCLTPALALAALPEADRAAFLPGGTLRFWQLLTIDATAPGGAFHAPITVADAVTQFLLGKPLLDDRLGAILEPLHAADLLPADQAMAERLARALNNPSGPVLHLVTEPTSRALDLVAGIGAACGTQMFHLPGERLPADGDLALIARIWQRDRMALRGGLALALEGRTADARTLGLVARLAVEADGPVIVVSEGLDGLPERCRRPIVRFDLPEPAAAEILRFWRAKLDLDPAGSDARVTALADRFRLPLPAVASCIDVARAEAEAAAASAPTLDGWLDRLTPLLREQARQGLDRLAEPVPAAARAEDLILPPDSKDVLRQIVAHHRRRTQVFGEWGFGRDAGRGLGLAVMFAGPSGTGKTMAAEVIARELGLDLYRIDLSRIVDKYIGETEKNLGRLFDAADACDAVLLFDEADALFGRRSEVRDSHDRYANLEVGYLLQRIEAYRGVAVLTTNLPGSIDPAFGRRLAYVVHFHFPDQPQRREIWRRAIPAQAPTRGLDLDRLARLSLSGGQIRSLAINAAMLAADQEEALAMHHIATALRSEFAKRQQPLPAAELAGWPL